MLQTASEVKSESPRSPSRKASWFAWARRQQYERPVDKQVMLYLIERARAATGACYPGQKLIASDLGYCERTIRYAVGRLVKSGLLEAGHRYSTRGKRTSNLYLIAHPDLTASGPLTVVRKPASTRGNGCRVVTLDSNRISLPSRMDTVSRVSSARAHARAREGRVRVRVPERALGCLALGARMQPWENPIDRVSGFVPERIGDWLAAEERKDRKPRRRREAAAVDVGFDDMSDSLMGFDAWMIGTGRGGRS